MTALALEFLTALEQREMRLLAWGYVDASWTADEVDDLADEFAIEHDHSGLVTGTDLVHELQARALLLGVDGGAGERYRTRMSETVRLLARLRQLFPKHKDSAWNQAATLVSDYRVVSRPRSYPKRDIDIDNALQELADAGVGDENSKRAFEAILSTRGSDDFRLSRFQLDATVDVLRGLSSGKSGGTIVGAGTGSGKTLAFYLPALTHIAQGPDHGTRVLAIYPRIELLRDQFAETFREARRLDGTSRLGRPIRIGALYGGTPHRASGVDRLWKGRGADRVCPYMLCPDAECGEGALIWKREDIDADRRVLHCEQCGRTVGSDRLSLTREQMRTEPPDVLFTTTEMLNRTLMDGRMRHLIGVGRNAMPIDLVLLDEVHTYEGTTGAQVAGVLRRWRHARRKPVHFVGLSATLREAAGFFADLTGLQAQSVTSVEPRASDLEHEGQEYMIAARADPHSGSSVLSTTIQASMLLQRVVDPLDSAVSGGAYGQRVFVFTDDLDVTNRLYFDLLDAEGLNSWGKPEKPSLAAMRNPVGGDIQARRAAGQLWDSLESIGHRLDDEAHTRIGRTTSQDADVDRLANAVVATASLEVGFNDPRVGAVLQHKAPHGAAAFLQRKGRAGRSRAMRPWTVIVLSDFGRDRITYQSYERLFDPELAPRSLPIANPAVVRMQAVFALMDWLVTRLRGDAQAWPLLQRPAGSGKWGTHDLARQQSMAVELERVLTDGGVRDELALHLKRSLGCSQAVVEEILWQPPRPLMTTVLPTALRRLRTQWRHLELGDSGDYVADGPLPEFVVSRLFADLALPEITVVTPGQTKHEEDRRESMRAVQALNAYAPGRVSHRLTISHRFARHWIVPGDEEGGSNMDVRRLAAEFEELGVFGRGGPAQSRVVRPLTVSVTVPPVDVLSSSHGRLQWNTEIVPVGVSDQAIAPADVSPLADVIDAITFHTHGALTHVEVRRWANESAFETHTSSGTKRGVVRFKDESAGGADIAVGIAVDVDGVAVDLRIPQEVLTGRDHAPGHLRGMRTERFRDLVLKSSCARELGRFNAERLVDSTLRVLATEAVAGDDGLEAAFARLRADGRIADAVFADATGYGDDHSPTVAAGIVELRAALEDGPLLDLLDDVVTVLWDEPNAAWDSWGAARLAATVGALVHSALQELCPEYDGDDVVVDLESTQDGAVRVWLTEQTIGGGGLIQEALRRIGDSPRTFFDLILAAADPSVDELVDSELSRITDLAVTNQEVADAIAAVRDAGTHAARSSAFDELLDSLRSEGVFVCHPVVSALSVRALRPGANERIDEAARGLLQDWTDLEARLGVDLELRSYATLRAGDASFDRSLGMSAPAEDPGAWRAGQITGLLWQRGGALRAQSLRAPNPFVGLPSPDPLLLRACLRPGEPPIKAHDVASAFGPDGALARNGEVDVTAALADARELRTALLRAACTPIEAGPLLHYPRAVGVRRDPHGLRARLVLDLVGE
jgi:superfamily II DNA or RNA helicase